MDAWKAEGMENCRGKGKRDGIGINDALRLFLQSNATDTLRPLEQNCGGIMETTSSWHRALEDPQLRALPYKVETNEHGQIVLSPHKPRHGVLQGTLVRLLDQYTESGTAAVEFAVETTKGVKVPDVVWVSDERYTSVPDDAEASPVMPEVVVEVLSEGNTEAEMTEKRRLYLEEGADEVWTCAPDGTMTFYDTEGEHDVSTLVPSFPAHID